MCTSSHQGCTNPILQLHKWPNFVQWHTPVSPQ